ncbi:hypothetical protein [Aquicoccus porphyridii]|uniref:hypothetical protein n=1 Tax=Aquicoccus porphyridii TaxID=1852029 RepID=UPI00165E8B19|nr:hypothetical protein [Aquicoccus porphyridii]
MHTDQMPGLSHPEHAIDQRTGLNDLWELISTMGGLRLPDCEWLVDRLIPENPEETP